MRFLNNLGMKNRARELPQKMPASSLSPQETILMTQARARGTATGDLRHQHLLTLGGKNLSLPAQSKGGTLSPCPSYILLNFMDSVGLNFAN